MRTVLSHICSRLTSLSCSPRREQVPGSLAKHDMFTTDQVYTTGLRKRGNIGDLNLACFGLAGSLPNKAAFTSVLPDLNQERQGPEAVHNIRRTWRTSTPASTSTWQTKTPPFNGASYVCSLYASCEANTTSVNRRVHPSVRFIVPAVASMLIEPREMRPGLKLKTGWYRDICRLEDRLTNLAHRQDHPPLYLADDINKCVAVKTTAVQPYLICCSSSTGYKIKISH